MNYLVILDDGHGIDTSGKRTPIFNDGTYMIENDFNSEVVQLIYNKLKPKADIDVTFTAEENYDVPLNKRVERANQAWLDHQAHFGKENSKCILISVHANAYGSGTTFNTISGVETYCCTTPSEEEVLASAIHKNMIKGTTQVNRGVQKMNFAILKGNMTSCLVECAFMTNINEAMLLKQESFRQECAEEITAGIIEYFGINEIKQVINKPIYSLTPNGTYQICGDVKDFNAKIVNQNNRSIEEPFCVNGTFFWHDVNGDTYPTSVLYKDGKTYKGQANHLPYPQSVFIIYKDNTVGMKRIKNIEELDLNEIRLVIGGVGLRNVYDSTFKYDLSGEGFIGANADVARKTNKTVIGYNKNENKIYLMCRNIIHSSTSYDLLDLVKDCEYDLAISVDGGGSTFMNNESEMVLKGDGRKIHNIIGFIL